MDCTDNPGDQAQGEITECVQILGRYKQIIINTSYSYFLDFRDYLRILGSRGNNCSTKDKNSVPIQRSDDPLIKDVIIVDPFKDISYLVRDV